MNLLIVQAIKEKRYLRYFHKDLLRIVQPHAYGIFSNHTKMLVAWHTGGERDKGEMPGWGQCHSDGMHDVQILDETFPRAHKDYNPNDKRFLEFFAKL